MRRLVAGLLIALGGPGVMAGSARAGGTLTPVGDHLVAYVQQLAGPAFAGNGLAWATPAPPGRGGYTVTVADGSDVEKRHVFAAGGNPNAGGENVVEALAASPDQVAFAVAVSRCADESACKYQQFEEVESSLYTGPPGQPLTSRQCAGPADFEQSVDLEGSVLAAFNECAGGATVRDLAAGPESPWREYPSAGRVRIAGHYLAVNLHLGGYDDAHAAIAVYDLRSGEQVYKLDPAPGASHFDVQDDGTLAFERVIDGPEHTTTSELDWASIAEPVRHRVADTAYAGDLRIQHGRIAVREPDRFRVFDLAGDELAATPATDAIGSFDFDGQRLVFALQPCEVTAIATWDLQGAAPTLPAGKCPRARLIRRVGVADLARRSLRMDVRCPATPALGCSGDWYARFAGEGFYSRWVALDPGEAKTVRVRLLKRRVCALARHHGGHATVYLGPTYTRRDSAAGEDESLRVTTVGKPSGCRR